MAVGVVGAYHSGITVADLGRSLSFYRDLLGLEPVAERLACEEYIQQLTDAAGGCLKLAHLRVPGSDYLVELLEYQGVDRSAIGGRPRDPGQGHICFFVAGLDALVETLRQRGQRVIANPVTATVGRNAGARIVYAQDPDGFWVELMEQPRDTGATGASSREVDAPY
jgi:lactoylglutathione lyase